MFSDKILRQFSLLGKFVYLIFVVSLLITIDFYFTLVAPYDFYIALITPFEIIVTLELLILITGISSLFEVFFLLLILIQIKKMDSILKERNFHAFFSYTLLTFIIVAVCSVLNLLLYNLPLGYYILLSITGTKYFAFFIVLMNSAWRNLKRFFSSNRESFPNHVAENAMLAIENFHFGFILYLFIMQMMIGAFYYLKGCILLSKTLKLDGQLKKKLVSSKDITKKTFEYSIETRKTDSLETKK